MNRINTNFTCRCLCGFIVVGSLILTTSGCLRNRWADGEGFNDHPALPRQNFGRPSEKRGQAGTDQRSRDIESSLGIEGSPPRFFER